MKKTNLFFKVVLISASILFSNCNKDQMIDFEEKSNLEASASKKELESDHLYQTFISWRYNENQIEDIGGFYLVDDDIVFDKTKTYSDPNSSRIDANIVTSDIVNIWINPDMDSEWINTSIEAINRWNNEVAFEY